MHLEFNNPYYIQELFHSQQTEAFLKLQARVLQTGASTNISTYELFIIHHGIECAMFPHLYPTADFTDTGILQHYQGVHGDDTNRVASIGLSWTRKVLSGVRAYGEHRDLAFFLYEKHLASKYFHAQVRAKHLGVTADVLTRDSQTSSGYWEIAQDSLADLVRVMLTRCYDEKGYPELYRQCRGLRGEVWLCAFPNLFLTIAPAEWTFPKLGYPLHCCVLFVTHFYVSRVSYVPGYS